MTDDDRVVVIGGGPAGLMAAGQAGTAGARVLLLEKMDRPGLKLGLTGKGRCNLTNTAALSETLARFGDNGRFLRHAFHRFFGPDLVAFLDRLGVATVVERGGRVFPAHVRAPRLAAILRDWLRRQGVEIRTGFPVTSLVVEENRVRGVETGQGRIMGRAVILATGGASYPATGSSGDGYALAAAVGHRIITPRPALVGLETDPGLLKALDGLHLRHVAVRLLVAGKTAARGFGEVLFRADEISGPVVLTLSGRAVDELAAGREVFLALDLKPALDHGRLDARLVRDFQDRCHEPLDSVLRGLLPRPLVGLCLERTGIDPGQKAGETRRDQRRRILAWLKEFRIPVTGHRGLERAIVTAGGVDLAQVDPQTMQSRLVSGLFLAGELLDLQAGTGGFNLQAAFSTGWLAGRAAAREG